MVRYFQIDKKFAYNISAWSEMAWRRHAHSSATRMHNGSQVSLSFSLSLDQRSQIISIRINWKMKQARCGRGDRVGGGTRHTSFAFSSSEWFHSPFFRRTPVDRVLSRKSTLATQQRVVHLDFFFQLSSF